MSHISLSTEIVFKKIFTFSYDRIGDNEHLYGHQYAQQAMQTQHHRQLEDIWQVGDMVEALVDDNNT